MDNLLDYIVWLQDWQQSWPPNEEKKNNENLTSNTIDKNSPTVITLFVQLYFIYDVGYILYYIPEVCLLFLLFVTNYLMDSRKMWYKDPAEAKAEDKLID